MYHQEILQLLSVTLEDKSKNLEMLCRKSSNFKDYILLWNRETIHPFSIPTLFCAGLRGVERSVGESRVLPVGHQSITAPTQTESQAHTLTLKGNLVTPQPNPGFWMVGGYQVPRENPCRHRNNITGQRQFSQVFKIAPSSSDCSHRCTVTLQTDVLQ